MVNFSRTSMPHPRAILQYFRQQITHVSYQDVATDDLQDKESESLDSESFKIRAKQSKQWIAIAILFLLVSIVEAILLVMSTCKCSYNSGTTITSPVPEFTYEDYMFFDDPRFSGLRTVEDVDSAWNKLTPPQGGFVKVDNPRAYGLLPNSGVLTGVENAYMVSVYHQLHCLMKLQVQHIALQFNGSTADIDLQHADHCFSYIRQSVICSGDTTLEGPDLVPVPGMSPLRGWDIKHRCRNWAAITEWMEENAPM